jgi:hypothetical protein
LDRAEISGQVSTNRMSILVQGEILRGDQATAIIFCGSRYSREELDEAIRGRANQLRSEEILRIHRTTVEKVVDGTNDALFFRWIQL